MSKVSLDQDLEKKLVKKVQRGDKKSFGIIFQHYYPFIKSYFLQRGVSQPTGEDLSSTVFEKALKGIDNFKWQGLSLSSWLYKIARNLLIDYYRNNERSKSKTYPIELIENVPSTLETPEEAALKNDSNFYLVDLLSTLPEREAQIISLKFFDGYTNKSIAQMLDLTETNVSTIIYRVVGRLRNFLSQKS